MISLYNKLLDNFFKILLFTLISLILYFFSSTLLSCILPFLLALFFSDLIDPFVNLLSKYLRLPRGLSVFFILIIFIFTISTTLILIGSIIAIELNKLSSSLPLYAQNIEHYISQISSQTNSIFSKLPPNMSNSLNNSLFLFIKNLSLIITKIASAFLNILSKIPNFIFFLIVTIISTFFMSKDKTKIYNYLSKEIHITYVNKIIKVKNSILMVFIGYIKAQLILMILTFIQSSIGLFFIGIDYVVLISFIASLVDILPIIGVGSVYWPLILYYFFTGSHKISLYLLLLYLLMVSIRQFLEPKIVSEKIGIYPLVTVFSMYIGLKLFGIIGLIVGPFISIIILSLKD